MTSSSPYSVVRYFWRSVKRLPMLRTWGKRFFDWYRSRHRAGPKLLNAFAKTYPRASFVQIGSNDGDKLDPLKSTILRNAWRGVMVEPVPYVFERLHRRYIGYSDRIRLENVAIADRNGTLPFFHLQQVADYRQEGLPFWYDQLGSFRKDIVLSHTDKIPDIKNRIVEINVPCVTFDALCLQNGIQQLDLLHTDTEGFDHEILKLVDFTRYRPKLVIYEHYHLGPEEQAECRSLMAGYGYESLEEGMDTWCLRTADATPGDQEVMRIWRRYQPGAESR